MDDEWLAEEKYEYGSIEEAVHEMQRMMAERPCLTAFDIDNKDKEHVIMIVHVGRTL